MKKLSILIILVCSLWNCNDKTEDIKTRFLTDKIPGENPLDFMPDLVPEGKLIHRGIFSPDFSEYYYTLSDKGFRQFDVYMIKKVNGAWSKARQALFNSSYNEHGMSFSPDGSSLYFSSTRPTGLDGMPQTWHIWKSERNGGDWTEPGFVDIPNLREKLLSHPSISASGTLYFHAGNLDYSEMRIYHSKVLNGKFSDAEKTTIPMTTGIGTCTPYISPGEEYLIFASIGKELDLMVSPKDKNGNWGPPKKFNERINYLGQGNPYLSSNFLFYASGNDSTDNWNIKWVSVEAELRKL